ncbi:hypothetical protein KI387_023964 [Taxus chinensis]|uniref:Uncharacterized protein n=1 Tax=Taxus chinensis TaxID=29808 RepID=A0AA38LCA7_TAXCH|nr:hypothetical protein KI387_023964 [Taxus chinensis]
MLSRFASSSSTQQEAWEKQPEGPTESKGKGKEKTMLGPTAQVKRKFFVFKMPIEGTKGTLEPPKELEQTITPTPHSSSLKRFLVLSMMLLEDDKVYGILQRGSIHYSIEGKIKTIGLPVAFRSKFLKQCTIIVLILNKMNNIQHSPDCVCPSCPWRVEIFLCQFAGFSLTPPAWESLELGKPLMWEKIVQPSEERRTKMDVPAKGQKEEMVIGGYAHMEETPNRGVEEREDKDERDNESTIVKEAEEKKEVAPKATKAKQPIEEVARVRVKKSAQEGEEAHKGLKEVERAKEEERQRKKELREGREVALKATKAWSKEETARV